MIRDVVRYQAPPTWGVLCIDVWHVESNESFYQHALTQLSKYPISGVISCTVDLQVDYSDVTVYNTLNHYLWNKQSPDDRINDRVLLDLIRLAGNQKTSQTLQDRLFDSKTVSVSQRETFNHHVMTHWPEIQDWIVLGSAWGKCLHYGPLGVDKLVDISSHKFYMFPEWSVQNEDYSAPELQQIHDDYFVWAPVADGGYRLITRANNEKWISNKTI